MRYAILGPLRVRGAEGPIELNAPKQRALLAMLLLSHRREVVSAERLIDVLWDEDPPATAAKALQVHVSQLRRALGPAAIVTRPTGYAIALEPGQLDLERFETLVERARGAPRAEAAELLREALAQFRGPPLADALLLGPASGEADRLESARLEALEQRLEHDLALGRHGDVAAELEGVAAEHPYRERLHAQLMLALYRCGRQADALDAYRRVRRSLLEDLGLDPSPELQRLETAILAQDPALELDAPPPPPALVPQPSLPVPATPLLGRDADLATAEALLADAGVRLLTLTGPGGIGKTRFALELAHRLAPRFADGARFVALAAVDDPALLESEIAQALGASVEGVAAALAAGELLLVIDNFEQILDAAPRLSRVLAASPRSKLLVTSRAALRIAGEHELAMPPLAAAASAELFLRRARALDPRLELGAGDEERIDRICGRLDGLPLAIELAAARMKVLTPAAILERLGRRLDLLSAGPRDAPARQQTLRAAIGWSYDLLDPAARAIFERLGVFAGGCTLEAAEAVCGPDTLDGIVALVEHSLLTSRGGRFGMLETVREYAHDRLAGGELDTVRRAHARFFADMVKHADRGMESAETATWLDRLDADRDNIRAAVAFATADGDAEAALTFCANIWRYWLWRGNLTEGRELVGAALALGDGPPELRHRALNAAGALASEQADFHEAKAMFEASVALAREVGDEYRVARVSGNLGSLALYELDYDAAIARYERTLAYMRSLDEPRDLSLVAQNLGIALAGVGDGERAVELLAESVELARRSGDPGQLGSSLRTYGRHLLDARGDPARALALLHEALTIVRDLKDRPGIAETLDTLAAVAGRQGDARAGAQLIGAARTVRAKGGSRRQPDEEAWMLPIVEALREDLGDRAFAEAEAEGAALELADALAMGFAMSLSAR